MNGTIKLRKTESEQGGDRERWQIERNQNNSEQTDSSCADGITELDWPFNHMGNEGEEGTGIMII
jgi:hypothetical protein